LNTCLISEDINGFLAYGIRTPCSHAHTSLPFDGSPMQVIVVFPYLLLDLQNVIFPECFLIRILYSILFSIVSMPSIIHVPVMSYVLT
jgi:hypothetical protein